MRSDWMADTPCTIPPGRYRDVLVHTLHALDRVQIRNCYVTSARTKAAQLRGRTLAVRGCRRGPEDVAAGKALAVVSVAATDADSCRMHSAQAD